MQSSSSPEVHLSFRLQSLRPPSCPDLAFQHISLPSLLCLKLTLAETAGFDGFYSGPTCELVLLLDCLEVVSVCSFRGVLSVMFSQLFSIFSSLNHRTVRICACWCKSLLRVSCLVLVGFSNLVVRSQLYTRPHVPKNTSRATESHV